LLVIRYLSQEIEQKMLHLNESLKSNYRLGFRQQWATSHKGSERRLGTIFFTNMRCTHKKDPITNNKYPSINLMKKLIWLLNKHPYISIALMSMTHINLGLILSKSSAYWWEWGITIVFILIVAKIFAFPWLVIKTIVYDWLKSDIGSFFTAMVFSFCMIVILSLFDVFSYGLVIILTNALVRLEIQDLRLTQFQEFFSLATISLVSLLMGVGMFYLLP
jgi:hypothetical protein